MFNIEVDQEELEDIQSKLKGMKKETTKALTRAINRTAITTRKTIIEEVQKEYTEKTGRAKRNTIINKASYSNPVAIIKATDKSQPSSYFRYSRGGRGGAKLQVLANHPVKSVVSTKGGEQRKAFVAKMSSGHVDVFQRQAGDYADKSTTRRSKNKTKHTERIRAFRSPSVSKMVEKVYRGKELEPEIEKILRKNIEHEISYMLSQK